MENVINISEECHVVPVVRPIDIGGGAKSGFINMTNWKHASIIVVSGLAANQATVTVSKCQDVSGTSDVAIAFSAYDAGATDVLGARAAQATTGFVQAQASCVAVFEVDATELDSTHPYIKVATSAAAANIVAIIAVLSGGRYPGVSSPTALT